MNKVHKTNYDNFPDANNNNLTHIGPGLLTPGALIFNRPIRDLMPKLSIHPLLFNHCIDNYAALIER